ncbi:ATP-binding cassette domain-containing protein [Amycolatopsis albidoflavus]|uniref:ATP-binding cassette domain-containing protein n=1 Tax=Amycolatopsis albidoflavus TaxID=102226 RepID=A0ABW5I7L6_9PSEU
MSIVVECVSKRYGAVQALDGISFTVQEGTVLGLLGPSRSGKTTMIRLLATLLAHDSGRILVDGLDIYRDARMLRTRLGLAGQFVSLVPQLTGYENLVMAGRLCGLGRHRSRSRAAELVDQFDLSEVADRRLDRCSCLVRCKFGLAAALVHEPRVLLLDEPALGLDAATRMRLWDAVGNRVLGGRTVLLATQCLEEADLLARRITVIDCGQVVAEGTGDEVKALTGGVCLEAELRNDGDLAAAQAVLSPIADAPLVTDLRTLRIRTPTARGAELLSEAVRILSQNGVQVREIGLRLPTLGDVLQAVGQRAVADRK